MSHERTQYSSCKMDAISLARNATASAEDLACIAPGDLIQRDALGQTPIHLAAVSGNQAFMQHARTTLVRFEPFVAGDTKGRTPLHLAVWNGHRQCVTFLADLIAATALNAQDFQGYTPLFYAVYRNGSTIVSDLLARGCSVGVRSLDSAGGVLPLHQACVTGQDGIVACLLGAPLDTAPAAPTRAQLIAALTPAASPDFDRHARELFINAPDASGSTPLVIAVRNRRLGVARLLLRLGADPVATDRNRNTPLHIAVNADLTDFVALLLEHTPPEAAWSQQNDQHLTPHDIASANGNAHLLRLIESRQQPSPGDDEGGGCLVCAGALYRPVLLACGHRFCMACATRSVTADGLCPFRCATMHTGPLLLDTALDTELRADTGSYRRREAVFMKQRALAMLAELNRSRAPNPPLAFDSNNACRVAMHGDLSFRVSLLKRELYVYHVLLPRLPDNHHERLRVLSLLVKGSCLGVRCCGGSAAILNNDEVVLAHSVQLDLAKDTALCEVLTVLAKCVPGWLHCLQTEAAAARAITSETPAPVLMSTRRGDAAKAKLAVEHFRATCLDAAERPNLHFDGKTWQFKNQRMQLSIAYEETADCVYMYSPVWNGLPHRPDVTATLYERLLRLNLCFTEIPGGGVGLDAAGDMILAHAVLHLGCHPETAVADALEPFLAGVKRATQCCMRVINPHATLARPKDPAVEARLRTSLAAVERIARVCLGDDHPWHAAVHAVVCGWSDTLATTAPRVAVLVGEAASVAVARSTMVALGFCCLVLADEAVHLDAVMLAMQTVHALASVGRVSAFHFFFAGRGANVLFGHRFAPCLLARTDPLPVAVVRHFVERLVTRHHIRSAQVVLDCDFETPYITPDGVLPVPHPAIAALAWTTGYVLRNADEAWDGLARNVWVLRACRAGARAGRDGHGAGLLCRAVYAALLASDDGTAEAAEEDRTEACGLEAVRGGSSKGLAKCNAFARDVARLVHVVRVALAREGQDPELSCGPAALHNRPFSDERAATDDILDASFVVPAAAAVGRVEMLGGALHGVYPGQEFDLIDPETRSHVARATVSRVRSASSVLDVHAGPGLLPGKIHQAVETHAGGGDDERLDVAVVLPDGTGAVGPTGTGPLVGALRWTQGDVPQARFVAPGAAVCWVVVADTTDADAVETTHKALRQRAAELADQEDPADPDPVAMAEQSALGPDVVALVRRLVDAGGEGAAVADAVVGFPASGEICARLGPVLGRSVQLRRLSDTLRQTVPAFVPLFVDCLTGELRCDAVVACDGCAYEASALRIWLRHHRISPRTGERLSTLSVYPARDLAGAQRAVLGHGEDDAGALLALSAELCAAAAAQLQSVAPPPPPQVDATAWLRCPGRPCGPAFAFSGDRATHLARRLLDVEEEHQLTPVVACIARHRLRVEVADAVKRGGVPHAPGQPAAPPLPVVFPVSRSDLAALSMPAVVGGLHVAGVESHWEEWYTGVVELAMRWARAASVAGPDATTAAAAYRLTCTEEQCADPRAVDLLHQTARLDPDPDAGSVPPCARYERALAACRVGVDAILSKWHDAYAERHLGDTEKRDARTTRLQRACAADWAARTRVTGDDSALPHSLATASARIVVRRDVLVYFDEPERRHFLVDTRCAAHLRRFARDAVDEVVEVAGSFGPADADLLSTKLCRLARYRRWLRVVHPVAAQCGALGTVQVEVRHERKGAVVQTFVLDSAVHHVSLPGKMLDGDVVRMLPVLRDAPPSGVRAFIRAYNFVADMSVTLVDRASILLQAPGSKTAFTGAGTVVEWTGPTSTVPREESIEHLKLFVTSADVVPIPLVRCMVEETPRTPCDEVDWLAFTVSYAITRPE